MTRNLKSVQTTRVEDVNVMDVLSKSVVVINKTAVEKLETALNKNK
jgi:ribosomal protein L4